MMIWRPPIDFDLVTFQTANHRRVLNFASDVVSYFNRWKPILSRYFTISSCPYSRQLNWQNNLANNLSLLFPVYLFKGILRQINDKDIKMILCI
jgi:hypothetical protein